MWELDGMQTQPLCLGVFEDDWVETAHSRIDSQIKAYEQIDTNSTFSLLALCHSPANALRRALASNIRHLLTLDQNQVAKVPEWKNLTGEERGWIDDSDVPRLESYGLTTDDIYKVSVPQAFIDKVSRPRFGMSEAMDLLQRLQEEQTRICVEYTAERDVSAADDARAAGRQKDYTAAIHLWVKKLAERGFLKELEAETR